VLGTIGTMLSGGKLFDEGMYGCVFTPPLECQDTSKNPSSEISNTILSKLIMAPLANQEWTIMKKIKKIPLWKNYFVISESAPCIPATIQQDKDISNCKVLDNYNISNFRILNLPYAGTPLTIYRIDTFSFDFMNFIIHFIEAGALLNLFGIVHRDIHQGNILIDNEQILRIIDYNLSIIVNNTVTINMLKHKYDFSLGHEPPDSTIVNAVHLGFKYQTVIDSIIQKKPIMKKIRNILGVTQEEQYKSLEEFYTKSKSVKIGDEVSWFNNYWTKIDSWAIGVNIVDLISKLILWPEFSKSYKKISPKIVPILKKMCESDPQKRIDCVQALNLISPNSFIIRKYAKPWINKIGSGL